MHCNPHLPSIYENILGTTHVYEDTLVYLYIKQGFKNEDCRLITWRKCCKCDQFLSAIFQMLKLPLIKLGILLASRLYWYHDQVFPFPLMCCCSEVKFRKSVHIDSIRHPILLHMDTFQAMKQIWPQVEISNEWMINGKCMRQNTPTKVSNSHTGFHNGQASYSNLKVATCIAEFGHM